MANFQIPPAYVGFVGFVKLIRGTIIPDPASGAVTTSYQDTIVRATTADINLSQEITKPDVVDSRYDRTVYQLGPKIIEGTLEFPAVYDIGTGTNIVDVLYRLAATRLDSGLLNEFDLDVKYAASGTSPNVSEFQYLGNIINTWKFSVSAEDVINISCDIIGKERNPITIPTLDASYMQNTRVATWNDARVEIVGGRISNPIGGEFVRSFEANINNNAERFYTLNTQLFPQAIAPTKRDVTGQVVLMGRHEDLAGLAVSNELYCSETTNIRFGFQTSGSGSSCEASFGVQLPNTVFEIETMALSNDLFETTVQWHSLPSAGTGIEDKLVSSNYYPFSAFDYDN